MSFTCSVCGGDLDNAGHVPTCLTLDRAGFVVGAMSFTMVLCTPFAGFLSDHFGARRVLAMGCVLCIVAGSLYAVVSSFPQALGVSVLLGMGNALWFPSQSALLALSRRS